VVIATIGAPSGKSSDDLPSPPQDQPQKKKENWQSVNVPPSMEGTTYAYDKNSIQLIPSAHGQPPEVELTVVVTKGDRSIVGKHAVFSFFCDGSYRFRINNSYPTHVPDLSQEYQLANIACAQARHF
jgi:hypothetical protein